MLTTKRRLGKRLHAWIPANRADWSHSEKMEPKKPASPTPSLANLRPCGASPEMPLRVDGSVVQAWDATATEAQAQQRR